MTKVADIYSAYDREKEKKLLLDFDDLLVETYRLLNDKKEVRDKYRETFRHLLVDEFQDTNPVQMELLKTLMGDTTLDGSSFWVCGDDWQSIYAFTGASVGNILNFESMFPQSKTFILNLNYRSTPQILKACQNLIRHNVRKIEKTLRTDNGEGDEVIVLESSTEEAEAMNLVAEIGDLTGNRGFTHKEIAVLYRANFQSRVIEEVFSQRKIPYHIENGLNFYSRSEVKGLLDYLRLISNPNSDEGDEALLGILNVPNRYIGNKFKQDLAEFAEGRGSHLYEALKSMPVELPYIRKNVKDFISFIDPLIAGKEELSPSELIGILRTSLDYDRFVTDDDLPSPDDVKIENLNQLQMASARHKDIESFLAYTATFDEKSSHDKEGVSLMTIHKAKGLEFPVVFLVGLIEGLIPSKKGDIEEERRICFVGISRAMKLLYLSYPQSYLNCPSSKSMFLDEILGKPYPLNPSQDRLYGRQEG
jgi:DNA helicase-2/ATP-dependent DNA helicase PcrA